MKIILAAWYLKDSNVGLGRYVRSLIESLGTVDPDNQYEVVMPVPQSRFSQRPNFRYRTFRVPFFKRRVWEQALPWLCGPHDILHLPYDSCVVKKRGKLIVTIHDVKPLLFATGRYDRPSLERLFVPDRRAMIDHVVTDSQASSADIQRLLGYPAERITVIYPGVDLKKFCPVPPVPTDDPPYVFGVAAADPTKNIETLISAFARMPTSLREQYRLIIAGDTRRRPELIQLAEELGARSRTIFTGIVTDDELVKLYQQATLFVFPSRYEGFGLPVLEAMACGCPVISSNASSLPEVAGHAALLVDPTDVEGFARDMERVLTDAALRQLMHERGLAQAAQFPWERTARETIAVYQNVLTQT